MRKRCDHERKERVDTWRGGVYFRTCTGCGETLPLGPASITAAVETEIRAAELASMPGHWEAMSDCERNGWLTHSFTVSRVAHADCNGQSAGWLARQIATHESEASRG